MPQYAKHATKKFAASQKFREAETYSLGVHFCFLLHF
jgi:hypothetical protein